MRIVRARSVVASGAALRERARAALHLLRSSFESHRQTVAATLAPRHVILSAFECHPDEASKSGGWSALILIRGKDLTEAYKRTADLYGHGDGGRRVQHVLIAPRSVKAHGSLRRLLRPFDITICDFKAAPSAALRRNTKPSGNRKGPQGARRRKARRTIRG